LPCLNDADSADSAELSHQNSNQHHPTADQVRAKADTLEAYADPSSLRSLWDRRWDSINYHTDLLSREARQVPIIDDMRPHYSVVKQFKALQRQVQRRTQPCLDHIRPNLPHTTLGLSKVRPGSVAIAVPWRAYCVH
jgi:hypothetical protein